MIPALHHSPVGLPLRHFLIVALGLGAVLGASARTVELTVLHTTDLHGHIWPTEDYDGRADVGGFLRCAARIEALRAEHPNTLLIDCGDTFQGSPESYVTGGSLLIDGLNVLRYDAWVIGNHEFDWGVPALRRLYEQAEIPVLAGNVYFRSPEQSWLPSLRPYVLRDVEGVRVAIIGLTTPGIPRWSRPHLLEGAMFQRSVPALQAIMPRVKADRADIVIVALHQGYKHFGDDFANEIQSIARSFPEIDVLIGGHTHTPVEDLRIGEVLYTQAGYHGIWLGRVDLVYDTVRKHVTDKKAVLEVMDARVPYHAGLLERWRKELNRAEKVLNEVIGDLPERLDPAPDGLGMSSMQQTITRAIAEGTGAELVLHGSLNNRPVPAGPLRYRAVWDIVPYENTIGIASLTPQEIRIILEENFSRSLSPHSLGPYGFRFTVARGEGDRPRIGELRDAEGQTLHARKRYRVAMNSYVLASGGERYVETRRLVEQPSARLEMLDVDTRSLVADWIRRQYPVRRKSEPVAPVVVDEAAEAQP
ncbi:MAG TPA: bifunctional UDP-sugar hydrolase/5'-nucleotidase [Kiritimatiellia bacterium]|nr:bifunctional UDP-sugar hydrolase/5'-nucleotidase [Kiritimatiellia bacterium]HMO99093.1 bifunctional UDP-sugar hydrolase/5'-nucleotidase [Kiritimatiellia bacterium]HMP96624.1 bifunctional UDP-sugar hydrolase/5'-nucleotidase [Kiritimatiellia bacterium]